MKVSIASDHAGLELKKDAKDVLRAMGHTGIDYGPKTAEPVDYPDYAAKVAASVSTGETERGILICGTGIGMSMAANKFHTIRAALCFNTEMARLSREHNDANVLCLGARTTPKEVCLDIIKAFISTEASKEERHRRRAMKIGTCCTC